MMRLMKTFVTIVVIMLFLVPSGARAQAEEDPCAPEAQRSPQLMSCAERKFKEATAELKRARAELYEDLEPRSRVKLRTAERLWLSYRKSNCDTEASIYEGGTIQPLIQLQCMARVTLERAAELRAQTQTLHGTD
ncbi:MAG: lysozyme inhibitor LprI family protein [Pyrinomonadaceae bacterium]